MQSLVCLALAADPATFVHASKGVFWEVCIFRDRKRSPAFTVHRKMLPSQQNSVGKFQVDRSIDSPPETLISLRFPLVPFYVTNSQTSPLNLYGSGLRNTCVVITTIQVIN